MATSTELLRAAEHMRRQSDAAFREANSTILNRNAVVRASNYSKAADALEAEAARLRFDEEAKVEAQRDGTCEVCNGVGIRPGIPSWNDCAACGGHGRVFKSKLKRSWPEGWPPFAVLRRAYEAIGVGPRPSTLWVSRYGTGGRYQTGKQYADEIRGRWAIALKMVLSEPSSP